MASLGMRTIVAGIIFLVLILPAFAAALQGPAHVVDGDSLEIAGQDIRLHGIDAPELGQTCWDEHGEFPCGMHVKDILKGIVEGQVIECEEITKDRYSRIVAICRDEDGLDLGRSLVRAGWAMAFRRYSLDYVPDEEQARQLKRGLWAARFTPPSDWRKMMRDVE